MFVIRKVDCARLLPKFNVARCVCVSCYSSSTCVRNGISGMLPADCEFHFLERSQRLELYGVDLHFAQVGRSLLLGDGHTFRSLHYY